MKRNRFNNFYMSYIGKSKFSILKVIIPILVFVICLAIYVAKISTALSMEKNNEDGIKTVMLPNAKSDYEIKLISNIHSIEEEVLDSYNSLRNRKYCCW